MKTQPLYPQRPRRTFRLMLDFLIACALFAVVLLLTNCTAIGDANPLDRPGDEKSSATLHEENMQAITSNPGYRIAK